MGNLVQTPAKAEAAAFFVALAGTLCRGRGDQSPPKLLGNDILLTLPLPHGWCRQHCIVLFTLSAQTKGLSGTPALCDAAGGTSSGGGTPVA